MWLHCFTFLLSHSSPTKAHTSFIFIYNCIHLGILDGKRAVLPSDSGEQSEVLLGVLFIKGVPKTIETCLSISLPPGGGLDTRAKLGNEFFLPFPSGTLPLHL